ncbi:MAG: BACON domain-containing protein [Alistipes sp.]|nr:BACON domain-containing protein [Alistipes sp.]
MRRYLFIIVSLLALVGCRNRDVVEPTISVEQNEIHLGFEEQDAEIVVESNAELSVDVDAEWVAIVAVDSGKKSRVKLHIEENISFESRVAKVEIKAGDKSLTVTIYQAKSPERIYLKVVHSGASLSSPIWYGDDVRGTIDWGDGSQERYSEGISHDYSDDGSHRASFDMAGPSSFEIERLGEISLLEIRCR